MATTAGDNPRNARNDQLFKASFSSASSLMALQLFSRLFTFVLNQALFRMVSPRAFGTAAIQFELLLSTILFLSREGVRNALLRSWPSKSSASGGSPRSETVTNLTFLPFIIGFPLAVTTSCLYGHFAGQDARAQPHFAAAIAIYALAAMTELLSEPMHNIAVSELRTGLRVRAEGIGITSKTLVTFLVLLYGSARGSEGDLALIAFASGQLSYGVLLFGTYTITYRGQYLWPYSPPQVKGSKARSVAYFDPYMLRLSLTMTSQSLIKHLLTEGDKFILSWFSPLQDQGGYAIAVNYGSLVARIIFQPIEESARVYFSKILSQSDATASADDRKIKINRPGLAQAAETLIALLAIQVSLSLIILVFGVPYLPIVLHFLLPSQYLSTSAPKVLTAWIWYIPVLAVNGGLEAFLSSVATPTDLIHQSRWMASFSIIYVSAALILYSFKFGDTSLVYANIINLSARIAYCLFFVSSYFTNRSAKELLRWKDVVPRWQLLVALALSSIMIMYSDRNLVTLRIIKSERVRIIQLNTHTVLHVFIGSLLGLACLATWWISSKLSTAILHRAKTK